MALIFSQAAYRLKRWRESIPRRGRNHEPPARQLTKHPSHSGLASTSNPIPEVGPTPEPLGLLGGGSTPFGCSCAPGRLPACQRMAAAGPGRAAPGEALMQESGRPRRQGRPPRIAEGGVSAHHSNRVRYRRNPL